MYQQFSTKIPTRTNISQGTKKGKHENKIHLQPDPSDMLHPHYGIDYHPTSEAPTTWISSKNWSKHTCSILHFAI